MNQPSHGFYIALGDIIGTKATVADLLSELTKIRRSDVLCLIANLTELLHRNTFTPADQLAFLNGVLPNELSATIAAYIAPLKGEPWTLFHRAQLWFVLQMSLLVGRDDILSLDPEDAKRRFAHCCLLASDITKQIELAPFPGPRDDGLPLVMSMLIASMEMSLGHEVLARLSQLWLEIPQEPAIKKHDGAVGLTKSIDAAFADAYGLPLQEFFYVITIMLFKFTESSIKEVPKALIFDPTIMFQRSHDAIIIEKAMALISSTPAELTIELLATPRQSWTYDVGPLLRKPILKETDNRYVCPDLHFLRNYFVQIIYELVVAALPTVDVKQLFGDIFARYISRIISSCFPSSPLLARTYYEKVVFEKDKGAEAGDGLLLWPSMAVLAEYKTGYLTTRQRYAMLPNETLAGINSMLNKTGKGAKGVGQLAKNITRILSGQKLKAGDDILDVNTCDKIYPAIVVYDELVVNHAVRLHLQFELTKHLKELNVDSSRVGPLLLFSMRDIEYFEELVPRVGAEKLIRDYAACIEHNDRDPDLIFHLYATRVYHESIRQKGMLDQSIDAVRKSIVQDMEKRRRERAGCEPPEG